MADFVRITHCLEPIEINPRRHGLALLILPVPLKPVNTHRLLSSCQYGDLPAGCIKHLQTHTDGTTQRIADHRRCVEGVGVILLQNEGLGLNLRKVAFGVACGSL